MGEGSGHVAADVEILSEVVRDGRAEVELAGKRKMDSCLGIVCDGADCLELQEIWGQLELIGGCFCHQLDFGSVGHCLLFLDEHHV